MSLVNGRWEGPVLDNHFHLDRGNRFTDAALDFQRAGGTHLVLVHKPGATPPVDIAGYRAAYSDTLDMAETVRRDLGLHVRVVLGPHPAVWAHQIADLDVERASELHLEAVELAITHCEEGDAVGVGEVGRPHWEVDEVTWSAANDLFLEVLSMCSKAGVPVQLHLEGDGEPTYSDVAQMCDAAGMFRNDAIHHHAQADVSAAFTHGMIPSVLVGKGCVQTIVDTIASNQTGFLMETDYMDDPRRPGAVLGPKTVPKRTQALATALIEAGEDAEEVLHRTHQDLPESLYAN